MTGDVAGSDHGASSTLQNRAILLFISCGRKRSVRQSRMSGWIPMESSSFTRVLGGLGLELSGSGDEGNQGDVDEESVLAAVLLAHLADGFEEGKRLDIADRAADFADDHIDVVGNFLDGGLDFVGDVRNHLHGFAEIVAAALLGDDLLIDAAGGEVIVAGEAGVGEALVVAEVEIGLGTIVGDEDLTMLKRRHGSGIDVEIGIELLETDPQAAAFQQATDARGGQSLAERRHNAARHKDVLCRHFDLVIRMYFNW